MLICYEKVNFKKLVMKQHTLCWFISNGYLSVYVAIRRNVSLEWFCRSPDSFQQAATVQQVKSSIDWNYINSRQFRSRPSKMCCFYKQDNFFICIMQSVYLYRCNSRSFEQAKTKAISVISLALRYVIQIISLP